MSKRRRHHLPNVTPGMLAPLDSVDPKHFPQYASVMGYGPGGFEEMPLTKMEDITSLAQKWPVVWVDVDGLGNSELNKALAQYFGLDWLVLEDLCDVSHFPKVEEYEKYIFMILKNGVLCDPFQTEQISMILAEKFIITFQERPGDSFNQIRERVRKTSGRIRQYGSDYLAYAVIDAVIESYYPILESMKKRLDEVEDTFLGLTVGRNVIRQIHDIKNDLLFVHSAIWPIYNITVTLAHDDMPIVTAATSHFLRDCQDQAKRVSDLSEFYRLIASDLMNTTLAFSDNQANSVMKVLTMVATVFIPLSFIASLYGMNFDRTASPYNMPELGTRYGYPIVLLFMLGIASFILFMFWRKGWFSSNEK